MSQLSGMFPPNGNHESWTEKTARRRSPIQNVGREKVVREANTDVESTAPPLL